MQNQTVNRWSLESDWIVPPKQARSIRSFHAVLEAATKLFSTKGFEGTSVYDISQASGVSTGSIYNRFPDKDAILQVIHDSFSNAVVDTMSAHAFSPENWKDASAPEIIMAMVDRFFFIFGNYMAISCLIERQRQVNPAVATRARKWDEAAIEKYWMMLKDKTGEIPVQNVRETLALVHYMLRETLSLTMIFEQGDLSPKYQVNDKNFEHNLMRIALRSFGFSGEIKGWKGPVWDPLPGW